MLHYFRSNSIQRTHWEANRERRLGTWRGTLRQNRGT